MALTKHCFQLTQILLYCLLCWQTKALGADKNGGGFSKGLEYLSLSLEELGKLKITIATGNETSLEQAPAVANVITAQQIKAMGARTLDEVLETVPGLHISLSGTNRLDSIYSIRGIHTKLNPQVLMLVNNVPLQYSVQGGRPLLFRQAVTNIARIEIIRGPGSAIYGADAFSGVINIITKSTKDLAANEIGTRLGAFDYREAWLNTGHTFENWNLAYHLNYQHSNGDDDRRIGSGSAPNSLSTRYETLDTAATIEGEHWKLNLRAWISEDAGNGAGAAQVLDPNSGDDSQLYSADITYHQSEWFERWSHSFQLSYSHYDTQSKFVILPPGTSLPIGTDGNIGPGPTVTFTDGVLGNPGATTEDVRLEFANTYNNSNDHIIRIAFGRRYQSVDTSETKNFGPGVINDPSITPVDGTLTDVTDTENVFLPNDSRTINFISLQDEWTIADDWRLIAGVRHDHYSDFGNTTNPRLALVWQTNHQLTTKLLYGSAFRAPSFGELGFQNNPATVGNDALDPEKIDTFELSFNSRPSTNLQSTLSLFSYEAEDLIDFVPTAENVRNQEGYGFEWELNWEINDQWRIANSFAWQHSKNSDNDEDVADAPGQQWTLNTYWQFASGWLVSGQLNWVGDRQRAASDTREEIDDYALFDFTIHRKNVFNNLSLSAGLRNAFDEEAREPSDGTIPNDFLLEGQSIWAEINYEF